MVDRIQRLLFRSRVMEGELLWARNLATATEIRIVTWHRQWGSLGMKRTELPLEYKRCLGKSSKFDYLKVAYTCSIESAPS